MRSVVSLVVLGSTLAVVATGCGSRRAPSKAPPAASLTRRPVEVHSRIRGVRATSHHALLPRVTPMVGATFDVAFDATDLTPQSFAVNGVTDWILNDQIQHLQLAAGDYDLVAGALGSATVGTFTVGADGTVDYPDALVGTFDGRGTKRLRVVPHQIYVDGRQLTQQQFAVGGLQDYFYTSDSKPFAVCPGTYTLYSGAQGGIPVGDFTVTSTGQVQVDPGLSATFTAQDGTLQLQPHLITINATHLTEQQLYVVGVDNYFDSKTTKQLNLIPGSYALDVSAAGDAVIGTFTVRPDGNIDYSTTLDGIFTGRNGTTLGTTLGVQPLRVQIDGHLLDSQSLGVSGLISGFDSQTPKSICVLPGTYLLTAYAQGGNGVGSFTVKPDGTLDFPDSENGIFDGRGGKTLLIKPVSFAIDGSDLTEQLLAVNGLTSWFDSQVRKSMNVLPGQYGVVGLAVGGDLIGAITVRGDGTITYDDALQNVFNGRDTQTLSFRYHEIDINGAGISEQSLAVYGVTSWFDSQTPVRLKVVAGVYALLVYADGGNVLGAFTVGRDGRLDYDASLDSIFTGKGGTTLIPVLGFTGHSITIEASSLTEQRLSIYGVTPYFDSTDGTTAVVLPGTYALIAEAQGGNVVGAFTVNDDGSIAIDPTLGYVFEVKDGTTLKLKGVPFSVDGSRLSPQQLSLYFVTPWFDSSAVQSNLTLLPGGPYAIISAAQGGAVVGGGFNITSAGKIDYGSELDSTYIGRGTNQLQLHPFQLTINATRLKPQQNLAINGLSGYFGSAGQQRFRVAPGTYTVLSDSVDSGVVGNFTVKSDGSVDYDAALEPTFGGRGSYSLVMGGFPTYDKVYGIATHNSYWMNRSDDTDYFASGTQEPIPDQLLHDHVRWFEIDVHSEGASPHDWTVYHTSDAEDFTCRFLRECLEYMREFHYVHPQHEVINIMVELHNTVPMSGVQELGDFVHANFTDDHTPEDLDQLFKNALGDAIYTPADFLQGCEPGQSLRACAHERTMRGQDVWPTIDKLRGKFIVNVLGNWSTAALDWAVYAKGDMTQRVGFPVQSVFDIGDQPCPADAGIPGRALSNVQLTDFNLTVGNPADDGQICIGDIGENPDPCPDFSDDDRQAAYNNSIFWQFENLHKAYLTEKFLADGGIIRTHDAFEAQPYCNGYGDGLDCQDRLIDQGFQFIQTNYPWYFTRNDWTCPGCSGIPNDPSQRFREPGTSPEQINYVTYNEPGSRLYFQTGTTRPGAWAFADAPDQGYRWIEATASSTRTSGTYGKNTHDGLIVTDFFHTCPDPTVANPSDNAGCTNYWANTQPSGEACIKAMSDDESQGMELCRQKLVSGENFFFTQETVQLRATAFKHGQAVREQVFYVPRYSPCKGVGDGNSDEIFNGCIGNLIALEVQNVSGIASARAYSASVMTGTPGGGLVPQWQAIGDEALFDASLTKQGFRGWGSAELAGMRMSDNQLITGQPDQTRMRFLTGADLPHLETSDSISKVVDLSY